MLGGYTGYATGVAIGVYGVGTSGGHEGSFGATMAGSLVGGLSAVALAVGSDGEAAILLPLAPIAGALIGFHTTSRRRSGQKREERAVGSLVNINKGEASLGLPMLSMTSAQQGVGHTTLLQVAGGPL